MKILTEKILFAFIVIALLVGLIKVLGVHNQENKNRVEKQTIANPASVNCDDLGGTLTMETRGDGGQYGVCHFPQGGQCEEWALYRGECPQGGVPVSGFDTKSERYCLITGGQFLSDETLCKLPNGATCSNDAYYNGMCG